MFTNICIHIYKFHNNFSFHKKELYKTLQTLTKPCKTLLNFTQLYLIVHNFTNYTQNIQTLNRKRNFTNIHYYKIFKQDQQTHIYKSLNHFTPVYKKNCTQLYNTLHNFTKLQITLQSLCSILHNFTKL